MKKKYIELTCTEASALLPIFKSVTTLYEDVYEKRLEDLDINHMSFLKESISLLRDGVNMDLSVVLEVNEDLLVVITTIMLITLEVARLFNGETNVVYFGWYIKFESVVNALSGV